MPRRREKNISIQEGLFQTLKTFSAEDLALIAAIEADYCLEWEPDNNDVRYWIRQIAEARCKMQKADRLEADVFSRNMPSDEPNSSQAIAKAFLADSRGPNYLEKIQMFRSKAERQFSKGLHQVNQALKGAPPAPR